MKDEKLQKLIDDMRHQAFVMRESTKTGNGKWRQGEAAMSLRSVSYTIDAWTNELQAIKEEK